MDDEYNIFFANKTFRQLISFGLVGLLTNGLGYALYLVCVSVWGAPKATMTLLYLLGAVVGFFSNRRFTFHYKGSIGSASGRYIAIQAAGYLLNLAILIIFVDWCGFSHQLVQAVAIIFVAIFLFVMLRHFVFVTNIASPGAK